VNLSTGDTVGQKLSEDVMPFAVFAANKTVRAGQAAALYWRGSIVLSATMTGNRFSSGAYLLVAVPLPHGLLLPSPASPTWLTSLPHAVIRVATGQTVTLTLPWKSPFSALFTKSAVQGAARELYRVGVYCLAPLRQGTGAFGTSQINVYAQLQDSEYSVPDPSGITAETYLMEADLSTTMSAQEVATHRGATISARGEPTSRKPHAAEIRSLHDVIKRFTPYPVVPLTWKGGIGTTIGVHVAAVKITSLLATGSFNPVAMMFRSWQGEINVRARVYCTLQQRSGAVVRSEPAVAPPMLASYSEPGRDYCFVIGYCPFAVAERDGAIGQPLLFAFANMLTGNGGNVYHSSAFVTLGVADHRHPWLQVVVPFTTDLNNVLCGPASRNTSPVPCNVQDTGWLFFGLLTGEKEPGETASQYCVQMYVAGGDSFRFNAFGGIPTIRFEDTGIPTWHSPYPARIMAP